MKTIRIVYDVGIEPERSEGESSCVAIEDVDGEVASERRNRGHKGEKNFGGSRDFVMQIREGGEGRGGDREEDSQEVRGTSRADVGRRQRGLLNFFFPVSLFEAPLCNGDR